VGEANLHDNADGPAQAASPRPCDRTRSQAERRAATKRLLAWLKAIDSTQEAQSADAHVSGYVRKQEPLILRLLDAGAGMEEILPDRAFSFSSISRAALRHTIGQPRDVHIGTRRGGNASRHARVQDDHVAPQTMP